MAGNGNGHRTTNDGLRLVSFVDKRKPVGAIEVLDKDGRRKEVPVFRVTIGSQRAIVNMVKAVEEKQEDEGQLLDTFRQVVGQCCPTMVEEEIDALEEEEVGEVIRMARTGIVEAEKALGDGERSDANPQPPAGSTPKVEGSSPLIPSST